MSVQTTSPRSGARRAPGRGELRPALARDPHRLDRCRYRAVDTSDRAAVTTAGNHRVHGATLPAQGVQEESSSGRSDCGKPHKGQLPRESKTVRSLARQHVTPSHYRDHERLRTGNHALRPDVFSRSNGGSQPRNHENDRGRDLQRVACRVARWSRSLTNISVFINADPDPRVVMRHGLHDRALVFCLASLSTWGEGGVRVVTAARHLGDHPHPHAGLVVRVGAPGARWRAMVASHGGAPVDRFPAVWHGTSRSWRLRLTPKRH